MKFPNLNPFAKKTSPEKESTTAQVITDQANTQLAEKWTEPPDSEKLVRHFGYNDELTSTANVSPLDISRIHFRLELARYVDLMFINDKDVYNSEMEETQYKQNHIELSLTRSKDMAFVRYFVRTGQSMIQKQETQRSGGTP
jgi:hypothetical protein